MNISELLLIFPPLVYTNFGKYYPSTALLAGFLETHGVRTLQMDLNHIFLSSLLSSDHNSSLVASGKKKKNGFSIGKEKAVISSIVRRELAVQAVKKQPGKFSDSKGRFYPYEKNKKTLKEIFLTLSEPYYHNPDLSTLFSDNFWELPQTKAVKAFFESIDLLIKIPESLHTIGISVPMGPQLATAYILARTLKESFSANIVFGGPTITLLDHEALEGILKTNGAIDAVIKYQGERPLLSLAKYFANGGKRPWKIPGVLGIHKGQLMGTNQRKSLLKSSSFSYGYYDPEILKKLAEPKIGVRLTEGCYWGKCSYCDYIKLYPESRGTYQVQNLEMIVDEIEFQITQHGIYDFKFITESLPPGLGRRLGEKIIQRGLEIRWSAFAMVDSLFDKETLNVMAKSGCDLLVVGVETVNDRVLRLIRKNASKDSTKVFFENCKKANIKIRINLIPNLPTTTKKEAMETLDFITVHLAEIHEIGILPFEATRTSDVGKNPEKFGLKELESTGGKIGIAEFCLNNLEVRDDAMTPEELDFTLKAYSKLMDRANKK